MDYLAKMMEHDMGLWGYWGFEPWHLGAMSGVRRRVAFVKPALIGEVARYYAIDTIVWVTASEAARENLWTSTRPAEDVMTQRFLFLVDDEKPQCRIKSFLFGIKGYKELYTYWPGKQMHRRLQDLAPLVDKALALREGKAQFGGGA